MTDYFVESQDVETQQFDWGTLKWMTSPAVNDSQRFSAGVVILQPGKGHELHTHPESDEILYVLSGYGEQEIAGETKEVGPGEMMYIPEGVEHGTINTTWQPMQILAVYGPPGPEEQLADLPGCEIIPPGELPE